MCRARDRKIKFNIGFFKIVSFFWVGDYNLSFSTILYFLNAIVIVISLVQR